LHAEQATVGAQPELAASVLNGKPAVRFDGKGRFLAIPAQVVKSQQFTIVAVVSDRAGNASHREIISNWRREDNVGPAVFFGTTGAAEVRLTDYFAPAGNLANPANHLILTGIAGAAEVATYQDRTELARR